MTENTPENAASSSPESNDSPADQGSNPVDVDLAKAKPLTAGDPVEAPALSQLGSTFAIRKAAREGKKIPKAPEPSTGEASTFASRKAARLAAERGEKQVRSDSGSTEDKAVKKAATKRPARKRAAKKTAK